MLVNDLKANDAFLCIFVHFCASFLAGGTFLGQLFRYPAAKLAGINESLSGDPGLS
jgi:hypothetical protein